VYYGSAQYVPDISEVAEEDGGGGGSGGAVGAADSLDKGLKDLIPSDMDPLERARLEWALDGKMDTVYPEALAGSRAEKKS